MNWYYGNWLPGRDNILRDLMDMKQKHNRNGKKKRDERVTELCGALMMVSDLVKQTASFALCPSSGGSKLRWKFYGKIQYPVNIERKSAISGKHLTGWPKLRFTHFCLTQAVKYFLS